VIYNRAQRVIATKVLAGARKKEETSDIQFWRRKFAWGSRHESHSAAAAGWLCKCLCPE